MEVIHNNNNTDEIISSTCGGVKKYFDVKSARYYYCHEDGTTTWDAPAGVKIPLTCSLSGEDEIEEISRQRVAKEAARQERLQLIERRQKLHAHGKQLAKNQDELERRRKNTKMWENACKVAERNNGVLSVSWVKLENIHPMVFNQRGLVSLKLIGTGLKTLPDEVGLHLNSLTCLSVANNCLTVLPDSLCKLSMLKELDLVQNQLEVLPENFGSLVRLNRLHISGNCLQSLPNSFGNLVRLKRVVLDGNNIRILPETLGHMNCSFFSINFNKLVRVPHCVKNMPNLETFSACNNVLRSLPGDIGSSQRLRALHLSSNKLTSLPEGICQLKKLEALWLDHNHITGLPLDFHHLLSLSELKLDNNTHMVYPPVTVIEKGIDSIRVWCKCRVADRQHNRRHTIVLALQNVLSQIHEFGASNPAHFNSRLTVSKMTSGFKVTGTNTNKNKETKKHDDDELGPYIGIVWDQFWEAMLPRMEEIWAESFPAGRNGYITDFAYSHQEVELILKAYQDAEGAIFIEHNEVPFLRCDCRREENLSRRRVCIPPNLEWMCKRRAHLMRMDIVLERQAREQRRIKFEQEDIEFRMEQARKFARKEATKPEGKKHYKQLASKLAEDIMRQKAAGEVNNEMEALKQRRINELDTKFDKEKEKITIIQTRKLKEMQARLIELEEEANLLQGWEAEQKRGKIEGIKNAMKSGFLAKENQLLEDLERKRQENIAEIKTAIEKKAAKHSERLENQRTKKLSKQIQLQDLVHELVIDLVNKEVEKEAEKTKKTALEEHAILHRVTSMWLGLGMKETFTEWKVWVKRRVVQRRKDRKQAVRQAWHDYKVANAGLVVAEQETNKWEELWDEYNDVLYWVHRGNGEIRYDSKPVIDEYLPEGYVIPEVPKQSLEYLSESEDEEETSSAIVDAHNNSSLANKEDAVERRSDADLLESTENNNKTDYYSIISKEDIRKSKIGTETDTSILNFEGRDVADDLIEERAPSPYPSSVTAKVEAEVARAILRARELHKRRVAECEIRREKRLEERKKMAEAAALIQGIDSDDDCHTSTSSFEEEGSNNMRSLGSDLEEDGIHSIRGTNEPRSSLAEKSDEEDDEDVSQQNIPLTVVESSQSKQEVSGEQGVGGEPIVVDHGDNLINTEINPNLHNGVGGVLMSKYNNGKERGIPVCTTESRSSPTIIDHI